MAFMMAGKAATHDQLRCIKKRVEYSVSAAVLAHADGVWCQSPMGIEISDQLSRCKALPVLGADQQ